MPLSLPKGILFDLDDTILSAYGRPEAAWRKVAQAFVPRIAPVAADELALLINDVAREFWADAARHKEWRAKLGEARREIVRRGCAGLGFSSDLIAAMADRFTLLRDEEMALFPGACETLDELKARGVRLALITNGSSEVQRAKITRFALGHRFEHIQIEGEHGFGKPEERAYLHAMQALGVTAPDTWMIGDNLEWEVVAPQRLGIYAIWIDVHGDGLPADSTVRPDRIIRSLTELLPDQAA